MSMRDPFPPQRPDVKALFGRYLADRGLGTDLLAEAAPGAGSCGSAWQAGRVELFVPSSSGRLRKFVGAAIFFFVGLGRASRDVGAIQVRDQIFLALPGLIVARLRGIKFFYWMSFPFPEGYLEIARSESLAASPMRRFASILRGYTGELVLYRMVAPRADHLFVQSARMLEAMAARGVQRDRMTAVPMGVDLASLRAAAITPAVDHRLLGGRPLVYLGALDRVRRIDFLLHVLARIRLAFPQVILILAGDASEPGDLDWLRREAQRIGVDGAVVWLGWLPSEQAWSYVKCAEVGLSPIPPGPLYEVSSPTKALEYMALGVPVVGSRIPDQEMVLRQSQAGVVVDYDVAAFADATIRLLMEPARARAMGARGPEYIARERDYSVIADRVAAVYRSLLTPPSIKGVEGADAPAPVVPDHGR